MTRVVGRTLPPVAWPRLLLELATIFIIFHGSASVLGSDTGQSGMVVAVLVVAAVVAVEMTRTNRTLASACQAIGLGAPRVTGLIVSSTICAFLLLLVPVFARSTGTSVTFMAGSLRLLPGLLAQGGIAEEALFRGYLFGHLRQGRSFWRAASLSMLPFVAVHLLLFATMSWVVAAAALLLSVVLSFPLAHLYELGGRTIWPPALLHFVVQGTVKLVIVSGESAAAFPLVWIVASALLPLLAFVVRRPAD